MRKTNREGTEFAEDAERRTRSGFSDGHLSWAARREEEFGLSEGLDLIERGIEGEFAEEETVQSDVNDGELGDNVIDDFNAGEREGALSQDLGLVVAGSVLHRDEDAFGAGNEVHRAAHAFQHFAGYGPVGERSLFVDLERA